MSAATINTLLVNPTYFRQQLMKYAQSLVRQNQLFDAAEADYNSFKDLLLNCPCCRASVYLVKSHHRGESSRKLKSGDLIKVSSCDIPAFFSHHSQEEFVECENYNHSLGPQSLAKSLTIAHHQRLEIFRDRFIGIFVTAGALKLFDYESAANIRKAIQAFLKIGWFVCAIPATLFAPVTPIQFRIKLLEPYVSHLVKFPYRDWGRDRLASEILPSILDNDIPAAERVGERQRQLQCTIEALDFLFSPPQRKLLTEIAWVLVLEIAGSICHMDGQEIMSSAEEIGMAADRQKRIAALPRFFADMLQARISESLYHYAAEDKPEPTIDSGIRLPLKLLLMCLLTINWDKELTKKHD